MYIALFSSRVYGASYLLYLGALYVDVHLRAMPPIAKLTAHPLRESVHTLVCEGPCCDCVSISGIFCTELGVLSESYHQESTLTLY